MKKLIIVFLSTFIVQSINSSNVFAAIKSVKGSATLTNPQGTSHVLTCPPSNDICYSINTDEGLILINLPSGPKTYGYSTPPVLDPIPNEDGTYNQIGGVEVFDL